MYVNLIFNIPLDKKFIYHVPEKIKDKVSIFKRVKAPFGKRKQLIGIIIDVIDKETIDEEFEIKDIYSVIDEDIPIEEKDYIFAKWISKNNFCSLGEVLPLFYTRGKIPKSIDLRQYIDKKEIKNSDNNSNISNTINNDENNSKNNNENNNENQNAEYKKNDSKIKTLQLTEKQNEIYNKIKKSIDNNEQRSFLIFGVTGSGKTEIYLHVISDIIKKNKQVILLIPEIALTSQVIRYFFDRLGNEIAVIHSYLKQSEKLYQYNLIRENKAKIIIGPRSALFAPVRNLGGIIIDEEHDDSYKSDKKPRYHTRLLALKKCVDNNAILIMGSATPSIETFYFAKKGFFTLFELNERYNKNSLPDIEIIDLKTSEKAGNFYITKKLYAEVKKTLENDEKVILYLNRRGFSNIVTCLDCGEPIYCPKCSIPMTYHKSKNILKCHYCNFEMENIKNCPYCGSENLRYKGVGTEKIEEDLKEIFKNYNIERFDADSVKEKGGHNKILNAFRRGEIDVLIGTQMITKGHHFPEVTLVGVINGDTFLNFPDFRANEKTFQTLVQVAGRAGRGEKKGKVLIQTMRPDHYAINLIQNQDYKKFYENEIKVRKEGFYPPFSRILRILVRSKNEDKAYNYIKEISLFIKKLVLKGNSKYKFKINVVGPSAAPFEKIDENFRFHLILKSNSTKFLLFIGTQVLHEFPNKNKCYVEIDLDPVSML